MNRNYFLCLLGVITLVGTLSALTNANATSVAPGVVGVQPRGIKGIEKDIAKINIFKYGEIQSITLQQVRRLPWLEKLPIHEADEQRIEEELESLIAAEAEVFEPNFPRRHPILLKNLLILPEHPLAGPNFIHIHPRPLGGEADAMTEVELFESTIPEPDIKPIHAIAKKIEPLPPVIPPIPRPTKETIAFQMQKDMRLLRLVVRMKYTNQVFVRYIRLKVNPIHRHRHIADSVHFDTEG